MTTSGSTSSCAAAAANAVTAAFSRSSASMRSVLSAMGSSAKSVAGPSVGGLMPVVSIGCRPSVPVRPRRVNRPVPQTLESRGDGARGDRSAGGRPTRARARPPPTPGGTPLHRPGARVRGRADPAGGDPCGSLLRQGGGREGTRARRVDVARRGDRRRRRTTGAPAHGRGRGAGGGARRRRGDLAHPHARHGRRGRGAQPVSLPGWLDPLLDTEQMRATDAWAIDTRSIPSLDLMERAGEGLADVVSRRAPGGRVAVVCGKGNNGGDGLVAARHLRRAGRQVDVLLVWPAQWLEGDAATMLERLGGPAPQPFEEAGLKGAHVIVDALLGTGFQGAPRAPADAVIAAINATKARVIAADVPSGVNAGTGQVEGDAVHAFATATFHRGKPGLWIAPGKTHAGLVETVDIGIPRGAPAKPHFGLINGGVLRDMPRRGSDSTKFSSGNVFILGGSSGLTGAPSMSALAAMRAGAGYVTVGAPASLELSLTVRLLEAMMIGLPESEGALSAEAVGPALKAIDRADAVVLGPGLSKRRGARDFALEMFERIDVPLVIDADGLNALEGCFPEDLPQRRWPTVLTPHAGELGRLLGVASQDVGARRLEHALEAANSARAFVVLKGDDTLVVSPGDRIAISRGGA